ncbi:hypothetical protein ACFVQ0_36435 [Streptomyces sp. NPDC057900]|uniref:hypothetical protein n=1 Tax=Streptomyces sp. NPDC057900 TaxID=3346274 RepID=UPI0036F0995F
MAAVPLDLLDRIRALEREVRTIIGRASIRPALDEINAGRVQIGEGGSLEVRAPDGTGIFGVGKLWDGTYGVVVQRSDGTLAFNVGGSGEGSNMVRLFSRAGDALVMDDYYSREFLGRPWMPISLFPTMQQGTTLTTYQAAWVGGGPAHNAVAYLNLSTIAGTGGGQVRIRMTPPRGAEVEVAEYDIPANTWTNKTIVQPLHNVGFLEAVHWIIEHRAKTNGSPVETRIFRAYTRNTQVEGENPDPPPAPAAAEATPFASPTAPPFPSDVKPEADEPGLHTITD